ncbi:hypothetical protein [Streptomyces boncukensis]|uniref:Uncharacterized protein n=1 Tax=Streptomyces boncukensis TaxID=2711219 RepID=A0A6G4X2D4_9ACTN|nr:hypothetical protein [Streptomyces boncukensis]NGO70904.1 hypothetical protein [Streptomyces boncukensis]
MGELPRPATVAACKNLAGKLAQRFGLDTAAADAFAWAAVDPAGARKAAEAPERLPVPGGAILALRTAVWTRSIVPDPRNPRISSLRRHPVSGLVGTGEGTRFRPPAEPKAAPDGRPGLVQHLESQEHLAWAAKQARDHVLQHNDWRESLRHQGVMTEVWLAATTFRHGDGAPEVTVPVTAEGSSRLTCAHDLLGVRSADVPYLRNRAKLRTRIRSLNEKLGAAGAQEQIAPDDAVAARCETVPALLIVGFEPHAEAGADFAVAVRSLVALRHVDPPKSWGEAAEQEALADAVVDEIERRGLVTGANAAWLRGALAPSEASAAGFSADPATRTAAIVRLFTTSTPEIHQAVRIAITGQSTRKRITTKLLLDLASSLAMRSAPLDDARKRERLRKYFKTAFSSELGKEWEATFRSPGDLAAAALRETAHGEPGPATRELAARSAYPLVVQGQLAGDRGNVNSDQPDRRHPGEVLDRMRDTPHGVHQMKQALTDFADGRRARMVDESGAVRRTADGRDVLAKDAALRRAFPPAGEGPSPVAAPTAPGELLGNALHTLGQALQEVSGAVKEVEAVRTDDGLSAIDVLGADPQDCDAWRDVLQEVLQKLPVWRMRSVERHGTGADGPGADGGETDDVFEDGFEDGSEEDTEDAFEDTEDAEDAGFAEEAEDGGSLVGAGDAWHAGDAGHADDNAGASPGGASGRARAEPAPSP